MKRNGEERVNFNVGNGNPDVDEDKIMKVIFKNLPNDI